MAMEEDGDSKIKIKDKIEAASIARDITAAFASGAQNAGWTDVPKAFADGLALI